MANNKFLEQQVVPSASRMMRSLRNLGYDFSQAVADLVDNSIEAGSSVVLIDVEFDGDHSRIRIADNGTGMTLEQLKEAMRYGSERLYDYEEGLGKFGLGLKTASLSQCRRLSIATRQSLKSKEIHALCWDLSHIENTNRWELIVPDKKELERLLDSHLSDKSGTVVLWQQLDRMLGFKHPYGELAQKSLANMCRDLEKHLAMVFHRYLDGEVPGKKISISLNGNKIKPWDPFARGEKKTISLEPVQIRLEFEGVAGIITLEPYILPHQDEFSNRDAFNNASGPANWNQQQGFYVYRANRLIQSGGWSKLRTVDEHTKLARVAISFSPHLDDAFKINVAKMRVQLPAQIKDDIQNAVGPVIKLAKDVYGSGGKKSKNNSSTTKNSVGKAVNKTVSGKANKSGASKLWTLDDVLAMLKENAFSDEMTIIEKVFHRMRKKLDT